MVNLNIFNESIVLLDQRSFQSRIFHILIQLGEMDKACAVFDDNQEERYVVFHNIQNLVRLIRGYRY